MPPSGVTKGYQRTLSNTRLQHDDSIDLSFGTIMAGANPTLLKAKFSRPKDTLLDKIIPKFVSKHVRNMCHELQAASPDSAVTLEPSATESFAAVVMVDVSQYSKLTATLAERGSVGVGLLSATMKGYFDQIIEIINNHGGDVVKFAGDALVFCWKSKDLTEITDPSGDVSRGNLVYKASRCCLQLLTDLGTYAVDIKDCDTKLLKIHLGIGAGIVFDVVVGGGRQQRWEHFIAGEGASQLSQVLDLAKAGELALSHQALKWLTFIIDIRTLNLGNYDKRCIILTGLEKAEKKCEPPVIVEPSITYDLPGQLAGNLDLNKKFMDRTALFKLQDDLHQSMLFGMDVSLKELLGLSELRQVTTIFIKIGSLQVVHRGTLLDESQRAISIVLNALDKCEGNLRQFHVDDKGAVILCFFGLPPMAHENDAMLGIQAGIEIQKGFKEIFDNFSIGITTGVLSFGGVGTKDRAEYAVV